MMIDKIALFFHLVGFWNGVFHGPCDLSQGLIFKSRFCNQGHIVGAGIVVLFLKTMGIGKMGIDTSKFLGFLIHHLDKFFNAAPHLFGYAVGRIIGGLQHQRVQGLAQGDLLPRLQPAVAAALLNTVDSIP